MKDLISKETRNAFGKLIYATHSFAAWPLLGMMRDAGIVCILAKSEHGVQEAHFRGVDWRKTESVQRVLPFFEEAYRRAAGLPKLLRMKHEMRLKAAMAHDHLSFDDRGHLDWEKLQSGTRRSAFRRVSAGPRLSAFAHA